MTESIATTAVPAVADTLSALEDDTRVAVERLWSKGVVAWQRLYGGRNSLVFKATAGDGTSCAAKRYFPRSSGRDHQRIEFDALTLLASLGVKNIPSAIALDKESKVTLLEFVDGEAGTPTTLRQNDVEQAVSFVAALRRVSRMDVNFDGVASEAALHARHVVGHIRSRLDKLISTQNGSQQNDPTANMRQAMRDFVDGKLMPQLERSSERLESMLGCDAVCPPEGRTLSPSDFGWHNGVRRPDGTWRFWDFEHFGWDDAAKLIVDFTLHPANRCPAEWRRSFIDSCIRVFADDPGLPGRISALSPLFVLKWCAILLNEFLPDHASRRTFATGEYSDYNEVLRTQLERSQVMLTRIDELSPLLTSTE